MRNSTPILVLTFLFFLPFFSSAQVAVTTTDESTAQGQTSITLNFSVPAGEDRMLLVSTGSDLNPLSLTFDGTPMTLETSSGGGALWTLVLGTDLAAAASGDLIFTIAGATAAQYLAISAIAYTGVDQSTPVENVTNQPVAASAVSSSITIASKTNDLVYDGVVIGCLFCFSAPSATATMGSTTLRNNLSFVGAGFAGAGATGTTPGATSVSPGWNFAGSSIAAGTHNGLNVRSSISLPVELSSFKAKLEKGKVILDWQTLSELNSFGFEVERSSDGTHFEKIGFLESRGNSTSIKNYNYTDRNPLEGLMYFRLKQLDLNGDFDYSNVIAVEFHSQSFSLFPNPAKNRIQIETAYTEAAELNIFDGKGQLVKQVDLQKDQLSVDISELPLGVYMVVLSAGQEVFSQRLIKME